MSNLAPKYTPTTFSEAKAILDAKNKSAIPLCFATQLMHTALGYAIVHHDTPIVTFIQNGEIYLNADGWSSRTTADRMHRFTPSNVRVNNRKGTLTVTVDDVVVGDATFGITINPGK